MHDDNVKRQIFHFMKLDLICHFRSNKVTFMIKNQLFLEYAFCLKCDLLNLKLRSHGQTLSLFK